MTPVCKLQLARLCERYKATHRKFVSELTNEELNEEITVWTELLDLLGRKRANELSVRIRAQLDDEKKSKETT